MTVERRFRAIIAYDGTDFLGYQIQATGRTVQGEIEKRLEQVTQIRLRIDGAGRTDAGVHATGQVIAFTVAWKHTLDDLHRALNAVLPHDIVISDLSVTSSNFHPRFSALSRTYQYTIINQPWPDVLQQRYAYHVSQPLDIKMMSQAGQLLIGVHDFASFGKPPQGNNCIRQVTHADWSVSHNRLIFTITANAFLYRMVRTIVETLVQVGLGRLTIDEVRNILEAKDLTQSAPPAPACGLCLVRVDYPAGI